ncbi:aminotransferase class I/II-fold pyridoxal phosphate-dependent enzyme [candidate division KSB3 bacterium]|uniref:Aminotransferase n=1 Tax=candidate division KSB3 bacterium TaxID=2044937 RepID=A0A9D5Q7J5_9BACT|nr:aminotransferase class I/II-fold pyridoxal phosphate-dependent enzyme [candidate division KSB3 bacterium]MBD3326367.1 aminotransferase class I/II-fold pyridoxal phosphate-dependent enzyme [candidate division KSB3 bacterium]
MSVSSKAREIPPFIVMDVLEHAQQLERNDQIDVIHLEVGEPDFDTPACIINATVDALHNARTHYTHSMGIPELREAIAAYYEKTYQVAISPEQVLVTSGTSAAMVLLFAALLEAGDEVILSNPHYACYPNFIRMFDGVPVDVDVSEDKGFQYTVEGIQAYLSQRTKSILINSPSNPTGNLLSPAVMQEIAALAPRIISDEIYHGLVYEGRAHSILEYTDRAFVLNGFSKLFAMTGWRLGYLIAPKDFVRPLQKLQQNFFICANSFVQWGGIAALTEAEPETRRMKARYNERRKLLLQGLRKIGFGVAVEPTGAFYVFANATKFGTDSYKLAFDILEHANVAVTPGIDFGTNGEGYLRFSYANSLENIQEGLRRLDRYLNQGKSFPS